jgi:ADP-ribose pyrophosphatase YjhB (NUDIX family)
VNALRELHEETGFHAELERLVGVYDNKSLGGVSPYQFYICCFRARITSGDATPSGETPEVVLADPALLPENMSLLQRTMLADSLRRDSPAVYQ